MSLALPGSLQYHRTFISLAELISAGPVPQLTISCRQLPAQQKPIGDVLPNLKGKLDGYSYRVPVIDGSIVDLSINLKKEVSVAEINEVLKHYADTTLKGIMQYTEEAFVSSDILGNTHSSIVDGTMTKAIGKLVKVVAW